MTANRRDKTGEHFTKWPGFWSGVWMGWLIGTIVAVLIVAAGMEFLWRGEFSFGGLGFVLPVSLILTLPTVLVRLVVGEEDYLIVAVVIGAGVGVLYFPFTIGSFLPFAGGRDVPVSDQALVYVIAGAVAGATWWGIERLMRSQW